MKTFTVKFKSKYEQSVQSVKVEAMSEVDAINKVFDEKSEDEADEVIILSAKEVAELKINSCQKAAYAVGVSEYHAYSKMANWEDFAMYIGHPDD